MISSRTAVDRIGRNVSIARHERGESIRALADAVGAAPTSIHQLLNGTNDPRVSLVAKIAEHYGITVDDLLRPSTEFQQVMKHSAPAA